MAQQWAVSTRRPSSNLRSRGVPEQVARAILTYAFAREMVDLIPLEDLRARVENLVADRLATSPNERAT